VKYPVVFPGDQVANVQQPAGGFAYELGSIRVVQYELFIHFYLLIVSALIFA
jgi:hypothetical protein